MKLKQLQSLLQDVSDFDKPKQKLEQYITGAHLASVIVHEVGPDCNGPCQSKPRASERVPLKLDVLQGAALIHLWLQIGDRFEDLSTSTAIDLGCGTVREC
jgi:hypothetical protein